MDDKRVILDHLKSKSITPIHKRILHKAKRYYQKNFKHEEVSKSGDRTNKRNQHKAQNYYNRKEREKIAKLLNNNELEHIKRYIVKNKTPVSAARTNVSANIPVTSSSKPIEISATGPINVSAEPANIPVTSVLATSPIDIPAELPVEPFVLESKHGSHKKENQAVESSVPLQEPAIRVNTERKPIRAAEKKNPTTQSRKQIIDGKQTEKPVITPPLKVVPLKSFLLSDIQEEEPHIKSKNLLKQSTKGTLKLVKEINRRFVVRANQRRVQRRDQIVQSEVERAKQQRADRFQKLSSNASTAEISERSEIEATGNPPGKKKPKKFAKSTERLEYKEYSPKVKGVIKADFKATNELRLLSPFIICVAIIAYARARIANRTMLDLPGLEVNMSDIHHAWISYQDAAKGVYDQALPLRERVARVVQTVKNKRTLLNLTKNRVYKYESGAANFLYKLTFDGTYNCVAGTLLMYTLIKYCDSTIDVRFALITGHVLLAFYDNGTEMFLETATLRTPILSRNEVEQLHKKTVFVCPKEHPTGMTQFCEYLINMVSINLDEYDDNLIFQCIPLLMRYNLQHSDDLNVTLFTNLCLRRCVSNVSIKPYDCVRCIYTTLTKSLWTNKNKCLYTICLTSFLHILDFIRPDSLLNEFKHFKNITVNQTLLKIHKMLIDIERTITIHRHRYHAKSDCSQIDEKRVQSNRRLVGLAELARTKIPHKRILKLSSDLKQTRFNTYEKKAEYLIDNYNDRLDTQFTFISKNVYVCGNIMIKFAPNTTDEHLQYELLEYEIYILSQLKDKTKHIVNILHYGNYNNHMYLITSNLTKYVPLNEITDFHFDYRSVYHQVQEALRAMHEHGYAHYNMVLNNIMFNPNTKQICIVDFSRFCVKDWCLHTDTLDSKSPSYPPYYGQILAANQPKHTDYYFMAVVLVFLISKGTVNPINKTRTDYLNAVKTFVRTLTDQHEQTQIKTTFVLSAIDDSGRFSYRKIFSAHTPKSTPRQQLDAKYLIDTKLIV